MTLMLIVAAAFTTFGTLESVKIQTPQANVIVDSMF
jgi:hypothetical protein